MGGWIAHLVRLSVQKRVESGEYDVLYMWEDGVAILWGNPFRKRVESGVYESVYLWVDWPSGEAIRLESWEYEAVYMREDGFAISWDHPFQRKWKDQYMRLFPCERMEAISWDYPLKQREEKLLWGCLYVGGGRRPYKQVPPVSTLHKIDPAFWIYTDIEASSAESFLSQLKFD